MQLSLGLGLGMHAQMSDSAGLADKDMTAQQQLQSLS